MSSSCKKSGSCGSADAVIAQQNTEITRTLDRIKNKILVMSGKGGVGKSTVSVNLALGLARRGYQVGLMDIDLHGPDICRMLALKDRLSEARSPEGLVPPMRYSDNLKVISLEYMMENRDEPIIWRGPLKIQAIRQFIADMDWGELDYLVIDAPPGTGDEPLTVANTIKDAQALVVTTPQEVSLADVRKSINFCRHVKMNIAGLVENMSGLVCPHCAKVVDLFKSGGGEKLAREYGVNFFGRIPLDPKVVLAGDDGIPYLTSEAESPAVSAFSQVIDKVVEALPPSKKISLTTLATGNSCGCGSGPCNPGTCDC